MSIGTHQSRQARQWLPGVASWQQQRKAVLAQWCSTAWWSTLGNFPFIWSYSLTFSRWISTIEKVKLVLQVLLRSRVLFIVVFYSHVTVTTCEYLGIACGKPLFILLSHFCLLMGLQFLLPFMCIIFLYHEFEWNQKTFIWAWWHVLTVSATQQAEAEGLFEPSPPNNLAGLCVFIHFL